MHSTAYSSNRRGGDLKNKEKGSSEDMYDDPNGKKKKTYVHTSIETPFHGAPLSLHLMFCSRKMMPEGKPKGRSSPGSSGWASCVLVLKVVVGLFIWEFVGASSSASSSKTPIAVPALSLIRGGIVKSSSGNDNAGRLNAVVVDANDIIDDMALASRQRTDKPERDTSEQVFKSTHVYRPSPTIRRSKRKRR